MSEQTLQQFLSRLNEDADFRESAAADPEGAFAALGLSVAEKAALTASDEDALRRLTGTDVSGYFFASMFCSLACPDTPGSGLGCGTGTVEGRKTSGTNNGEGTRTQH
jgi:hypothetical protein